VLGVRRAGQVGAPKAAAAPLSEAPPKVGGAAARATKGAVVSPAPHPAPRNGGAATQRTPAETILPALLEPLKRGEGIRIGWLGNTRQGKTYAAAWVLEQARAQGLVDVALVVDDKDTRSAYDGLERTNPDDLQARPPAEDEDQGTVIYRGVRLDPSETVSVNEVAEQAWDMTSMPGRPRLVLIVDELRRAVSPAGREWRAPAVARAVSEGAGARMSVLWATQAPQRIPVEAFDQSTLAIFKLGRRGRAYLERSDLISDTVSIVIAGLEPRQFVLIDDAGDWDGRVYEIPFRRR
jgi:hypothetical protein